MTKVQERKSYIIFGTPRTGGYFLLHQLLPVLEARFGTVSLEELFAVDHHSYLDSGSGIVLRENEFDWIKAGERPAVKMLVREARFKLLRKYSAHSYVISILPQQVWPEVLAWMSSRFTWIFLERQNLLKQLMSYLAACATGEWDGLRKVETLPAGTFTADLSHIGGLAESIESYLRWKRVLSPPPSHIFSFEEMRADPRSATFVRKLGLDALPQVEPVSAQPLEDDLSLDHFRNREELIAAYRTSYLQKVYPIDESGTPLQSRPSADQTQANDKLLRGLDALFL